MADSSLSRDLRARVDGEVRFDAGSRGAYSTDASNFRQVPIGVVVPRTPEAAADAVAVCREHGVPVLSRGGGTSLAGQCTNTAVVLDWSKYCHRVRVGRSRRQRTCVVAAGHRARHAERRAGADRAAVRPGACHAHELHARRHDRQQLVRRDRAADRQGRRQHRRARGAALRRHQVLVRADRRRRVHRASSAAATGAPRSTGGCARLRDDYADADPRALPGHPAPGVRLQPGLAAARARLRRRRAAGRQRVARWSRCCGRG